MLQKITQLTKNIHSINELKGIASWINPGEELNIITKAVSEFSKLHTLQQKELEEDILSNYTLQIKERLDGIFDLLDSFKGEENDVNAIDLDLDDLDNIYYLVNDLIKVYPLLSEFMELTKLLDSQMYPENSNNVDEFWDGLISSDLYDALTDLNEFWDAIQEIKKVSTKSLAAIETIKTNLINLNSIIC